MENKNININFRDNSDKATKGINNTNKALKDSKKAYDQVLKSGKPYEQQLKSIDKIVKETPLNVRDMNKQIQAYQSIALSAGRETPIGREALEKASALRDKYVDIQNETKRLADDHRTLNGVMELAGIGVAGFGAVKSAMALTGVENESLQKSMQKLMASQMLLNSVNQVAKALEKESASMLLLKDLRTKSLIKTQAIYTLVTGKTTKATKLFKIALASTGIGLLVVGIGLLISNFDKLLGVFKPVIDGFKAIGDAIGLTDFAGEERFEAEQQRHAQTIANAKKEMEAIDELTNKEKSRTATIQAQYQVQLKLAKGNAKEIEKINENILNESKSSIDEEQKLFIDKQKERVKVLQGTLGNLNSLIKRSNEEGVAVTQRALDARVTMEEAIAKLQGQITNKNFKAIQDFDVRRANIDIDYEKGVEDRQKASNDKYKQHLQNRLSAKRKIQDVENQLLKSGMDKELAINETKFARLLEDTKKNTKLSRGERNKLIELYEEQGQQEAEQIRSKYALKELQAERKLQADLEKERNNFEDKIAQITEDNWVAFNLSQEEREIRAVKEKYFTLETLAQGNAEALNEIEIARMNEENEIYLKFQNERDALKKKSIDDQKKLDQELTDKKFSLASQSFSALSELVGSFSAKNEKDAKRQFNTQKALNLAGAVTSTAQGITSALATVNPVPMGRFVEAGIVGAMGLANITKIASTKFESPNKSVSTTPSGSGSSVQAPNFNIVGDNNINQLAELQQQQPTKAYVVSSEVTSAQALDRKVEDFATL